MGQKVHLGGFVVFVIIFLVLLQVQKTASEQIVVLFAMLMFVVIWFSMPHARKG